MTTLRKIYEVATAPFRWIFEMLLKGLRRSIMLIPLPMRLQQQLAARLEMAQPMMGMGDNEHEEGVIPLHETPSLGPPFLNTRVQKRKRRHSMPPGGSVRDKSSPY